MFKWIAALLIALASTLHAEVKVLAFSGSTRVDSVNKKLALEASHILKELGADVTYIDLKDYPMPFYNADEEAKCGMPEMAQLFRQLLKKNQVIIIASPEYNHSFPAILKNALDWASRGEDGRRSRDAFLGKKFILMSASPSPKGGAKGLIHLRDVIEDVKGDVLPEEISIPNADKAFDEQGRLKDPSKRAELETLLRKALS